MMLRWKQYGRKFAVVETITLLLVGPVIALTIYLEINRKK